MLQTANHCRIRHPPRLRRVTGNTPAPLLLLLTPQLRCAVEDVDVELRQPSTSHQPYVMEEHQQGQNNQWVHILGTLLTLKVIVFATHATGKGL